MQKIVIPENIPNPIINMHESFQQPLGFSSEAACDYAKQHECDMFGLHSGDVVRIR